MSIFVKTDLIIGYRFSSLIFKKEGEIDFFSDELRKEVLSGFEKEETPLEKDITPELIALISNLEYIEFDNDGIIGKIIGSVNFGKNNLEIDDANIVNQAITEIKTKMDLIDPLINVDLDIKICMLGKLGFEE